VKYQTFLERQHFSASELTAIADGTLIDDLPADGVPTLPASPMLMFDRVVEIVRNGSQGRIVAEQDIRSDAWFFQCHFKNDPVQPGCLGVDAIWQLLGLYAAARGARGAGRALGAKEIEFSGQIRPHHRLVRYEVSVRRYAELPASRSAVVVGNGEVLVDGASIYTVRDARVGVFTGIRYDEELREGQPGVAVP